MLPIGWLKAYARSFTPAPMGEDSLTVWYRCGSSIMDVVTGTPVRRKPLL